MSKIITRHKKVEKHCKWCGAPADCLIKEKKEVKVFEGKKVVKAPKGGKYMATIVTCKECGGMNRFYGPRLVMPEEKKNA